MATIKELFRSLSNDHNLISVGAGVTKELIADCLREESFAEVKAKLVKLMDNLDRLVKDAQAADKKTKEIYERVDKIINLDNGKAK